MTIDRLRTRPPETKSPIRIFTRSHPRSLLSIVRSNSARSRSRCSRSNMKRISQISFGLSGRLAPSFFPHSKQVLAQQDRKTSVPSFFSVGRNWPAKKRTAEATSGWSRARAEEQLYVNDVVRGLSVLRE